MDRFDTLLEKLKSKNIPQTGFEWEENFPEGFLEMNFQNCKPITSGLHEDRHRWYSTSWEVLEIDGRYLGINLVDDIFSEQMGISDCDHVLGFCEMFPVQSVTYNFTPQ
jgi:hypothetical protein